MENKSIRFYYWKMEVIQMADNTMMDAINYVQENKLHKEANILANKVGDVYMACLILYKNIPQTEEKSGKICPRILPDGKRMHYQST